MFQRDCILKFVLWLMEKKSPCDLDLDRTVPKVTTGGSHGCIIKTRLLQLCRRDIMNFEVI